MANLNTLFYVCETLHSVHVVMTMFNYIHYRFFEIGYSAVTMVPF